MEANSEEKLNLDDHDSYWEAKINHDFFQFLKLEDNSQEQEQEEGEEEEEEEDHDNEEGDDEEDEEEEEFSFVFGGENMSAIEAEEAFSNGQIRTVFPLFNRNLLFSGEDSDSLPMTPPVKKIFVETDEVIGQVTSPAPENDEIAGPYCEWSSTKVVEATPAPDACKKSNSTGFSKIWRFKELRERSNSDGRDAFVFLNRSHAPKQKAAEEKPETTVKVAGKVKKGGKSRKESAHEVYLLSKAKEEQRRRSYLPYRPALMGFYTNVNVGLTKNVHPF